MNDNLPVALVTGAARRIGADIARHLHGLGFVTVLHYHRSSEQAQALSAELNALRAGSALAVEADLEHTDTVKAMARTVLERCHRLDLLVNNASAFYPTPLEQATESDWKALFSSNVKGPYFLSQQLAPALTEQRGAIVNLLDIHAQRPLKRYSIYCMAKAALGMMTQSLALELAPAVRVNAVAPGAILWPEAPVTDSVKQGILERIPLGRTGEPGDIAKAVEFLCCHAPYITGQILAVDGGRSLT